MTKYVIRKFSGKERTPILKALCSLFSEISYSSLQRAVRNKDVTVNGVRQDSRFFVCPKDEVGLYYSYKAEVRYEDENIIAYVKPKGIASVGENSFATLVNVWLGLPYVPLHRLDTNTDGLILFAKNQEKEDRFIAVMKSGGVRKGYLATVYGDASALVGTRKAYLFKDSKESKVYVSDCKKTGSVPISMEVSLISKDKEKSFLRIFIVSGKTHQIRAHLSFLGHFILGDGKYGNDETSKRLGFDKLQLTAETLSFNTKDEYFAYLNSITISL